MLLQELLLQAHLDIHPVMAVASAFRMSGSNGQPPNKVRKLNFATNHDEPENPSGTQYTELRREIDGLRRYIEELGEQLKATQESLAKETKAEIGLLAEKVGTQNAYLRQLLQRGAQSTEAQGSTFPISSPEEMMALDLKISPENRQIYITKMKELLLQANLSKSVKKVLGEEIILTHNIEGVSKKQALKVYASFFPALLEAISLVDSCTAVTLPILPLLRRQIVLGDDHQLSNDDVRWCHLLLAWSPGAPPAGIAVNGPPIHAWPGVSASPSLGSSLSAPIGRELSTASTATSVVCSSSAVNSRLPTVRRTVSPTAVLRTSKVRISSVTRCWFTGQESLGSFRKEGPLNQIDVTNSSTSQPLETISAGFCFVGTWRHSAFSVHS
ncbi:hypothetical protein ACLKA6_012216 [Drosophila palustris]